MSCIYLIHTLLSSMTVLSDSIHIGSMSPSRTIHLGPLWLILASSRMMLEKRPAGRVQILGEGCERVRRRWRERSNHRLSTPWWRGWLCRRARHWSQPSGWGLPTLACASCSGRCDAVTSSLDSFQCLRCRSRTQSDVQPAAPPAAPPNTHIHKHTHTHRRTHISFALSLQTMKGNNNTE